MITYMIKIVYIGGDSEAHKMEVWVKPEHNPEHHLRDVKSMTEAQAYIMGHREGVIGV